MKFNKFQQINLDKWNKYFCGIEQNIANPLRHQKREGSILFPNMILFTETKDHLIFELFGADRKFSSLKTKIHTEDSTTRYLYQFNPVQGEGERRFILGGGLNGLLIHRELDSNFWQERFPFYKQWNAGFILQGGKGFFMAFSPNLKSCYMNNCMLVNKCGNIHRLKHIICLVIANKKISGKDYIGWLEERFRDSLTQPFIQHLLGIQFCQSQLEENYVLSGQFSNIFLFPGLRETTIGEFLNKNPSILKKALSCKSFLYEPEFRWVEGNPDPKEQFINPDLIVELSNGYFDIYDLKTALLDKANITKGGHRRRRFIDYVQEGIAQLVNYREYFEFEKNKQFAQAKYNINISDPTLILVVGNYDNAKKQEIREASRTLPRKCHIIDYDTLNAMLLNAQ
jgi:hypothetical protein